MPAAPTVTPFIEKFLTIVRETCDPQKPGWAAALRDRLWAEYYAVAEPGASVTSEDRNVLHCRLLDLERLHSAQPALQTTDQMDFNHDTV